MKWKRADIIGATLAVLLGIFVWQMEREVWQPKRTTPLCQSNLKQVGLGMMQYIRDYDERMPLRTNWATALQPYTKNPPIFQCQARGELKSGYALYHRLAGISLSQISNSSISSMVFDADVRGFNVSDNGHSWPQPFRHYNGNNLLYMDGHVALRPAAKFDFPIGPTPTPYPTRTPVGKPRAKKSK